MTRSSKSPVDLMFDALEAEKPNHFAVRQYKKYKLAAGVVCSKRLLNQAVGKSLRTHNLKPEERSASYEKKSRKSLLCTKRLSRDDFDKDDDQQRESNSISNQKGNVGGLRRTAGLYKHCPFHGRWH